MTNNLFAQTIDVLYAHGAGTCLTSPDLVLLLDAAPSHPLVSTLTPLLLARSPLHQVAQLLAAQGFEALVPFGCVASDGGSTVAILRGDVEILGDAGAPLFNGRGLTTWTEQIIDGRAFTIRLAAATDQPTLALLGGVVGAQAALVTVVRQSASDGDEFGGTRAASEVPPRAPVLPEHAVAEPVRPVPVRPVPVRPVPGSVAPNPEPEPLPTPMPEPKPPNPVLEQPTAEEPSNSGSARVATDVASNAALVVASTEDLESMTRRPIDVNLLPPAAPSPDPKLHVHRPLTAQPVASGIPNGDAAPIARDNGITASRKTMESEVTKIFEEPVDAVVNPGGRPTIQTDVVHSPAALAPAGPPPPGIISSMPGFPAPTLPVASSTTGVPLAVVHPPMVASQAVVEPLTVLRSDVPTSSRMPVSGAPGASGPTVAAYHCPAGHPNAPHWESCRTCGQPVTDRSLTTIVRPTLGTLVLPDHQRIPLDRPVIIGRTPPADAVVDGLPARPVELGFDDPKMSRVHAEVRLAEWQVQVVDRDSLNGTFVELPGHPPMQLRPAEPFPIVPGTFINLGDCIRIQFVGEPA